MSDPLAIFTIGVIVVTGVISFLGFQRPDLLERLMFDPERILADKQYERMITSGLIHANWPHLIFNMFSFYVFGQSIEFRYGVATLADIYIASIVGGSLLSLLIHRHHVYRALGASGGVCGVIFAHVFLFPGGSIYMLPIPFPIPSWLFAIGFVLASFYGMKTRRGNIGHDAHLGGAILGLLVTTALYPHIVKNSPGVYFTILGLSVAIFIYLIINPLSLPTRSFLPRFRPPRPDPGRAGPAASIDEAKELDAILDKVSKSGVQSLTPREHDILVKASKRSRQG